jgi:hypothetical protein
MDAAAGEREALVARLNEAVTDHAAFTTLAHELAAAEERLSAAEARWLSAAEELGA